MKNFTVKEYLRANPVTLVYQAVLILAYIALAISYNVTFLIMILTFQTIFFIFIIKDYKKTKKRVEK